MRSGNRLEELYLRPTQPTPTPAHLSKLKNPETDNRNCISRPPQFPMYPAKYTYRDVTYRSAEQGFSHQAALVANKPDTAAQILATPDPYLAKRLAKSCQTSSDWIGIKIKTLEEIIHAKFAQNDHLLRQILATGNSKLFEATLDREFGVGYTLADRQKIGEHSRGQNTCGQLLEKVREHLS